MGRRSVEVKVPPEFLECTDIRDKKTADISKIDNIRNPSATIGDKDSFIDNKKLAIINALIQTQKHLPENRDICIARHGFDLEAK